MPNVAPRAKARPMPTDVRTPAAAIRMKSNIMTPSCPLIDPARRRAHFTYPRPERGFPAVNDLRTGAPYTKAARATTLPDHGCRRRNLGGNCGGGISCAPTASTKNAEANPGTPLKPSFRPPQGHGLIRYDASGPKTGAAIPVPISAAGLSRRTGISIIVQADRSAKSAFNASKFILWPPL